MEQRMGTTESDDDLITAAEAARQRLLAGRAGTSRQVVLHWEEKGLLKRAATVDGQPVFRRGDVLAFVAPSERDDEEKPTP